MNRSIRSVVPDLYLPTLTQLSAKTPLLMQVRSELHPVLARCRPLRFLIGFGITLALLLNLVVATPSLVMAKCLTPAADITEDGMTTVTDIQCGILLAVAYLTNDDPPLPGCLQVPLADADLNCDGVVNVTDIQISINFVLLIPLDEALDKDNNQCVDFCEVDTDGDGTADAADCVPGNAAIYIGAPESCNGWDDDCDGFIDEPGQGSTLQSCQDTTVCNGQETCIPLPANLGPTITEIFVDGASPDIQWFEVWNPSPVKLNLAGYILEDGQGTKHTINNKGPLFVRGGGHIVLASAAVSGVENGPYVNYTFSDISFAQTPRTVILRSAAGTEIDRVELDGPQFPPLTTSPIGLIDPTANNNFGWLWATTAGTPGGPNTDIIDLQLCAPGIPLTCVDAVQCTLDGCDDESGCTHTPLDSVCSDQNLCNGTESCNPDVGCTPGVAISCDDGDECTEDQCLPTAGCVHGPKTGPTCLQLPPGAVCALFGTAGQTVSCVLRAVRASKPTPPMVGLQFGLAFDSSMMQAVGFVDDFCTLIGGQEVCSTVDVPPGSLYPSGHEVLFFPKTIGTWNGAGSVVVLNLSDPEAGLTNGYIGAGKIVGDSAFVTLLIQLKADVPADVPVFVFAGEVKGSTAKAEKLAGAVEDGVMVLGLPSCLANPSVCDDENLCTSDSCAANGNCVHVAINCIDKNLCNGTETCNVAMGCLPGLPLECAPDADLCTSEVCHPLLGCNAPVVCDDGLECTLDTCLADGTCEYTTDNSLCSDGYACTQDVCIAEVGCIRVADDPACDDDDPCTVDICTPESGCEHAPEIAAECLPEGVLCLISGDAGAEINCPIRVARSTLAMPAPASLQFMVNFDPQWVTTMEFRDVACFGDNGEPPCAEVATPPALLSPQGHQVIPVPTDVEAWPGIGNVLVLNVADSNAILSDAAWSKNSLVGDSEVFQLVVTLNEAIPATSPVPIWISGVKGATSTAAKMVGTVVQGVMTLTLADCTKTPAVCDDENECTVDVCDSISKTCSYAAKDCTDGNPCTGVEACDPETGACMPGTAPKCLPDDDPCTTDGCSPQTGCNPPTTCDDGIACTLDICDPAVGCSSIANNAACNDNIVCTLDECTSTGCKKTPSNMACDDGDPCTTDSCDPALGCKHAPIFSGSCLPQGVFCALSGNMGETKICPVHIGRFTQNTPAPSQATLVIQYDPAAMTPKGMMDLICFGPNGMPPCTSASTPPSTLFPSGHTVDLNPKDPTKWVGSGTVSLINFANPTKVISDAYLSNGQWVGDTLTMEFHVTLKKTIPADSPTGLVFSALSGSGQGKTLTGFVDGGVAVYRLTDCAQVPNSCNDGNPCTVDACGLGGLCTYNPIANCP